MQISDRVSSSDPNNENIPDSPIDAGKDLLNVNGYIQGISSATVALNNYASTVNKVFGGARERVGEIAREIAIAAPKITEFGGTAADATNVMLDVSNALSRNVVTSSDSVKELFVTSKVLGQNVNYIVQQMTDVGVGFGQIQEGMQGAVDYVRSVGMNTSQIMSEVLSNMEMMNRFNFENGVQGLTKMAVQSAMLRSDMRRIGEFADKVMNPEGAIETAAAFQRLGVTTGMLADPFALMNASINDPEGLQQSIADVAQRFTYFDEKTKTFKIDPGGVRQMHELASAAGMSYREFSKMALGAANASKVMEELSFAGSLSEEDKMYIASISQMGDGGEYQIKVGRDEKGDAVFQNIKDLSEEQLKQAIEMNKKEPVTMEEIAKAQLDTGKAQAADLKEIKDRIVYGITGTKALSELPEVTRKLGLGVTDALKRAAPDQQNITRGLDRSIDDLGKMLIPVLEGKKSFNEVSQEVITKLKSSGVNVTDDLMRELSDLPSKMMDSVYNQFKNDRTQIGEQIAKYLDPNSAKRRELESGMSTRMERPPSAQKASAAAQRYAQTSSTASQVQRTQQTTITESKKVVHDGTITFQFTSDGKTDPNMVRVIQQWVDSQEGSQKLYQILSNMKDETGQSLRDKTK